MLKTELRNMERSQKREGIDMTYLKNVILKLLETGNWNFLFYLVAAGGQMMWYYQLEEIHFWVS
jgi:hypothetical protein